MVFLYALIAVACLATVLSITTRRKINRYEEKIKRIKEKNEEVKYRLFEENKNLRSQLSLSPHRREVVDVAPVRDLPAPRRSQALKSEQGSMGTMNTLLLLAATAYLVEKKTKKTRKKK